MVYSKHPSRSRKYKKNQASKDHKSDYYEQIEIDDQATLKSEPETETETETERSKKSSPMFGFLNSFFGNGDKCDKKSGKPLFNILDHDIYFDDLLLVGLILLLMTDKMEDELLLVILLYLLVDIF